MRIGVSLVMTALTLAAISGHADVSAGNQEEMAKKDLAALQGTWVIVGREYMGKKATEEELADLKGELVVKGNALTQWREDGKKEIVSEATAKLDPTAKPKAFDLTYTGGLLKGTTVLGIYEISGDSLKACFSFEEQKRPTEFTSKGNVNAFVMTYKRVSK